VRVDTKWLRGTLTGLLLSLMALPWAQAGESSSLEFRIGEQALETLDLAQLRATLTVHDIELFDPHYEKQKRFRAFAMADVMDAGFGDRWRSRDFTEVVFIASDGYRAVGAPEKLSEPGGYLAFADLGAQTGWEAISRTQVDPGPFYLVWLGEKQSTANAYPWPWQVAGISLVDFRAQYPKVYPQGAAADSAAMRGYTIFRDRCVRCHAMNRQGGKVGPDLNAPMSVTEYRSPMMIREFIRHPSRYRYSHMPDHEDLSEQNLDDLIEYFRHQAPKTP
jgi:mono/diheme cytochrome c family protein